MDSLVTALNMTREQAAGVMGISEKSLRRRLTGEVGFKPDELDRLAAEAGTSPEWFRSGSGK